MLARHRPSTPHWYLGEIGVSRDGRGAGVGTALLASRLETIDAVAQPAYLESSTPLNRRLYERFGFRTRGLIDGIPGALPAAMWRAARTSPA
ncbi:GNAT family N-acetyltransferase [Cellulomonas soli]